MNDEDLNVCEECGASVYKEHLDSGIAGKHDGRLLCSHCLSEYATMTDAGDDMAPIEFEDEDDEGGEGPAKDMSSTRIHAVTAAARGGGVKDETSFKRSLDPQNRGASRCRIFHCRISQGAVDFMVNQMNEWLDENEDIALKFATTTIGLFEGKHTEPNLITTVFY